MRKVALRFGIVDVPSESHKTHRKPIPYLGGVAISVGVIAISYAAIFSSGFSKSNFSLASSVLLPGIFISAVGLIDDFLKLSPWPRFLAQNLVGVVSSIILISTNTLGRPTGSLLFDVLLTLLWIVGLTNAINFFDNIDGGASGTVAISSLALFFLAIQGGQVVIAALALVLSAATLGFLIWNRPPARIYMGDAGSLFLGLILASLTIRLEPNPINQYATFAVPFMLVAVPILDTSVVVVKRLVRGISPFQGGRDHLSHRLMRIGLSKRQAISSLWLLSVYFALLAIGLSNASYSLEGAISLAAALSWLIAFLLFAKLADT
jgi:UDP-GlcNAc:undecaprenyl-phosphate GlcNAc-1-phosphate transferase